MIGIEYRPKVIDQIFGHDKIKQEIKNRFLNNNYPQVSYFTGKTGIGKTTFALNVAKVLQCLNKVNEFTPCNQCQHCKDINSEQFTSGTYLFNASNLGIDDMRKIEELTETVSWVSKNTIIIIDEFQELYANAKAQKNLLKSLEKPSNNVYFILLSMDDAKVDNSIKNRSVQYKLYPLNYETISNYLYEITKEMKIEIDEEKANVLLAIAENSQGSMRQACSHLERVIEGNIWTNQEVLNALNIPTYEDIKSIIVKIIDLDMEVFEEEITKETFEKINSLLILSCRKLLGSKLKNWQLNQIEGIYNLKNVSLEKFMKIMEHINKVLLLPYINNQVKDSILVNLFYDLKKQKEISDNIEIFKLNKEEFIQKQEEKIEQKQEIVRRRKI